MTRIAPAIMCGGAGTRLWPLSRAARPKQMLALAGELSMLAQAVSRALAIPGVTADDITLIATQAFALDLLRAEAQAGGGAEARFVIEPTGKNTAATAAIAALAAKERDPDSVVLLLSADQLIPDSAAFAAVARKAVTLAEQDFFVVIGVEPTRPHTGYGHIARGAPVPPGYRVAEFVEKPNEVAAKALFEGGQHSWNAGIFAFRPRLYLEELAKHQPAVLAAASAAFAAAKQDGPVRRLDAHAWSSCPNISIDYAVAEKTDRAAMIPATMKWSDVGSWGALWETTDKDDAGNVLIGDVEAIDTRNTYVRSAGRLVALVGVSDLVVVDTGDAIVITPRERSQDIKKIVEQLSAKGRKDVL